MTQSQADIRRNGRKARADLSVVEREHASEIITLKVVSASWFRSAEYLACYLPVADEVDTWEIISRAWRLKKRIFVPRCEKNGRMRFIEITPESDLKPNRMGIYEPELGDTIAARRLDVVITPLVAFDRKLNRVGMGGGYFDRTFSFLGHRNKWQHPKLVGVAFACQEAEEIAPNPWDIRVFSVVTESAR
ncbi:MAG: 5-formyltetrahydrofolate cyclo-ligase [Gammaproteobacteria bacterium]|nr:5-formyltetrahydrofolate cyclo-ligase [Gammaproteobacteria bacterium]